VNDAQLLRTYTAWTAPNFLKNNSAILSKMHTWYSNYQNDYLGTWTIANAHQKSKTCHVIDILSKENLSIFSFSQTTIC
jgi:hypothetical protein